MSSRRLQIAMISRWDLNDRRSSSGAVYYMKKALSEYVGDVHSVHDVRPKRSLLSIIANIDIVLLYLLGKILNGFCQIAGKKFLWERTRLVSRCYARRLNRQLARTPHDIVVCLKGAVELAYIETRRPVIYVSDANFSDLVDYYPRFTGLSGHSLRIGNLLQKRSLAKASACVYFSRWPVRSAVEQYGVSEKAIHVAKTGPNLDAKDIPDIKDIPGPKEKNECRLLLVGNDWYRKGCEIAIEAASVMRELGIAARLNICGCRPHSDRETPDYVQIIPFIYKNDAGNLARIVQLFRESSFFILPARAECYGTVLVEACAFGLPIFAADTGGISAIVRDGFNGHLYASSASGEDYGRKMADIYSSDSEYQRYSRNSRVLYEEEINWKTWSRAVKELSLSLIHARNPD